MFKEGQLVQYNTEFLKSICEMCGNKTMQINKRMRGTVVRVIPESRDPMTNELFIEKVIVIWNGDRKETLIAADCLIPVEETE